MSVPIISLYNEPQINRPVDPKANLGYDPLSNPLSNTNKRNKITHRHTISTSPLGSPTKHKFAYNYNNSHSSNETAIGPSHNSAHKDNSMSRNQSSLNFGGAETRKSPAESVNNRSVFGDMSYQAPSRAPKTNGAVRSSSTFGHSPVENGNRIVFGDLTGLKSTNSYSAKRSLYDEQEKQAATAQNANHGPRNSSSNFVGSQEEEEELFQSPSALRGSTHFHSNMSQTSHTSQHEEDQLQFYQHTGDDDVVHNGNHPNIPQISENNLHILPQFDIYQQPTKSDTKQPNGHTNNTSHSSPSSLASAPKLNTTTMDPNIFTKRLIQDSSNQDLDLGTVLVIGGCGFLGHHIVRLLLAEATCTHVHVMSRSPFKNIFPSPKVTYHIGDISNPKHTHLIISQTHPNVVFNTASPHAYRDHEHAYQYFTANVDGNRNLLDAIKEVGGVKAYVYTSSGPIIAKPGGGYEQATEDAQTLATVKKGDPYHLAKALGDEMVLSANEKFGLRTATVRPTALYGEGDSQLIEPVIQVLEDKATNVWLGYNDGLMDVVYVGHAAEAHLLVAKGLLLGLVSPSAPKIDGEAFNITDDEPRFPLTFFRKYWMYAGDKTPLSKVWYINPKVALWMAHVAEWWVWGTTWGKKRPRDLKVERMEFVIFPRTYSIAKIRERCGYVTWVNQVHKSQDEAIKSALEWYLRTENHGPVRLDTSTSWPSTPFTLINSINYQSYPNIHHHPTHYCIRNAQLMALTHNTFFRALNSIYHHAPLIPPNTPACTDFLAYCLVTYDFIHHHQIAEERLYFPEIEKASSLKGVMEQNLEQHELMEAGLEKFRKYAEGTSKEKYDGEVLREIIDEFADVFQSHNHEEIGTILDLHDKIDSETLKKIDEAMRADAEKHSDVFKIAPFVLGNQDTTHLLDEENITFPLVSPLIRFIVRTVIAGRHKELWRFNPSNLQGRPRGVATAESVRLGVAVGEGQMSWVKMVWFLLIVLCFLGMLRVWWM